MKNRLGPQNCEPYGNIQAVGMGSSAVQHGPVLWQFVSGLWT